MRKFVLVHEVTITVGCTNSRMYCKALFSNVHLLWVNANHSVDELLAWPLIWLLISDIWLQSGTPVNYEKAGFQTAPTTPEGPEQIKEQEQGCTSKPESHTWSRFWLPWQLPESQKFAPGCVCTQIIDVKYKNVSNVTTWVTCVEWWSFPLSVCKIGTGTVQLARNKGTFSSSISCVYNTLWQPSKF